MAPSTPRRRARSRHNHDTPHRDREAEAAQTPRSSKKPTNGLYQDGRWWCEFEHARESSRARTNQFVTAAGNCTPRQLCVNFETKRGPNRGKWFHSCRGRRCDFFIFDEDARLREREPVEREDLPLPPLPPLVEEPTSPFKQRPLTSFGIWVTPRSQGGAPAITDDEDSGEADKAAGASTPCPASTKRKRDAVGDEEEEEDYGFGDMTPEGERQLAALADISSSSRPQHGAAPPDGLTITPAITRTTDRVGGLPTPSVQRNLWPDSTGSRSSKRQKTVSFEDAEPPATATPAPASTSSTATLANSGTSTKSSSSTPTKTLASTTTDSALSTPSKSSDGVDVTKQVMTLLESQQGLNQGVLSAVRSILETSARKTKGLMLSRDATRSQLRDKDLRIATLQEKIMQLENKDKLSQKQISTIKADMMNIYQRN